MHSGVMGIDPLGSVAYPSREVTLKSYAVRRGNQKLAMHDKLEEHCGLVTVLSRDVS